ncbi:MAG: type I glutamate--ammonia ligase [Thermodesulfobacteriota bacterium]|nr:type I glutamate--ammonia ligase [Thermodesulfobacteriota bacterium]
MDQMTREDVLKHVKENDIQFIQFWFTDVLGMLKSFTVNPSELELGMSEGMGFDGSSIEGFARIEESDMIAMPDPTTYSIIPWLSNPHRGAVSRMFCDIQTPDGKPYEGDPRYVFKRMLKRAADMGFTLYLGPELEYFYLKDSSADPVILDKGGYFDITPSDTGDDLRRKSVQTLQAMGIEVEYAHHEVAPSQHEIDLRYCEGLRMADIVMTYRVVVKEVAARNNIYATFMPKPLMSENGSGMHVHQSLFSGPRNCMYDKANEYNLSDTGRYYIAGLLKHARQITAVTNQWVNSYKRLVPGYEAPVYVSWARRNRSALIRVPMYKPGEEMATRLEYRSPDPACNPYLAFSVMLAAGLDGMRNKYSLPDPVEEDIYAMSRERRKELGIRALPGSLVEAIQEVENSEIIKDALGLHIFNKFIENKKIERNLYRRHVSRYELERYLPIL